MFLIVALQNALEPRVTTRDIVQLTRFIRRPKDTPILA